MIRVVSLKGFALAIVAALASGCTLLLPTDDLITPCTETADCPEGFECDDNACLPIDEGDESSE